MTNTLTMRVRALALFAITVLTLAPRAEAQRRPLTVEPLTALAHRPTTSRLRFDSVRKEFSSFAVDGRIEFAPASKDFILSWVGADGTRQRLLWEPRNKVSAIVAADVTFDPATKLYTYSYTVTNLAVSVQKLQTIYVEGAAPRSATRPDESWYSRAVTPYLRKQLRLGDGWAWSQTAGALGIAPGQTVAGFRLVSSRPPAVVRCYAEGWTAPLQPREEPPDELHAAIDSAAWRLPAGFTIGPALSDPGDNAAESMSRLLSSLDEAARQGWLGSATSTARVRSSLGQIRTAVVARDTIAAGTRIAETLRDLNGPSFTALSSEGRALIEHQLSLVRATLRTSK